MMLACGDSTEVNFMEAVVWSVCLLAPLATFLALPKLLPLRRALTWSRINVQRACAFVLSRGDVRDGWAARVSQAWRRDINEAHPEGTPRGEVVRDERLLRRARIVGWSVSIVVLATALSGILLAVQNDSQYTGRLALTLTASGLLVAWIARFAATGAGVWAQAMALGRGGLVRAGIGFLVGVSYGAIAGFTAAFFGALFFIPSMSLLALDAPSSHDTMLMLTFGGLFAAGIGATLGAFLLTPLALAATRKK